jgi:hypothetical protein
VLRIFIARKNQLPLPGFEPAIFWSSGQQTNHYTTKATHFASSPYLKPSSNKITQIKFVDMPVIVQCAKPNLLSAMVYEFSP